jgi:metallopeptidase MepB
MGHALHDILSKTKYVRFHGYETTLDFVEMPSSLLENWCWKKGVLKRLSCHYTTLDEKYLFEWRKQNPGKPDPSKEIPDHWVHKLAEHRYFNRALFHLRQLYVLMRLSQSTFLYHMLTIGKLEVNFDVRFSNTLTEQ